MIDPFQLKTEIIEPVLKSLRLNSTAAVQLILGTAAVESDMGKYIRQKGGGPALGIYQMEPFTHNDIWRNFLAYKHYLSGTVKKVHIESLTSNDLIGNLWYSTAMCRVHYFRSKTALPEANDLKGLANMWKEVYNTKLGKGTPEKFIAKYQRYVQPLYVR
jgi:hypothetical protein